MFCDNKKYLPLFDGIRVRTLNFSLDPLPPPYPYNRISSTELLLSPDFRIFDFRGQFCFIGGGV